MTERERCTFSARIVSPTPAQLKDLEIIDPGSTADVQAGDTMTMNYTVDITYAREVVTRLRAMKRLGASMQDATVTKTLIGDIFSLMKQM